MPTIPKVEQKIGPAYDGHRDDGKHGSACYSEAGQRMWRGPTWCIPTIPERQGASLEIYVGIILHRSIFLKHYIFSCCLQAFLSGNGMDIPSVGFMMLSAQPAWLKSLLVQVQVQKKYVSQAFICVEPVQDWKPHMVLQTDLLKKKHCKFPIRRMEQQGRNAEHERLWPHPQRKEVNLSLLLWKAFPVYLSLLLHDELM